MQHIKAAKIVKKFDSNGIVINTKQQGEEEPEVQGNPDNTSVLDQTASSATKKAMKSA